MSLTRRAALGGGILLFGTGGSLTPQQLRDNDRLAHGPLPFTGQPQQGGFLIFKTAPGASLRINLQAWGRAGPTGLVIVGLDRDAPALEGVCIADICEPVAIAPVAYDVQRIDGLPSDQVEPSDPALLARIKAELARKTAAFASRDDTENFKDGFVWPLEHAIRTSKFGPQRILNGVPKTPHYGVDLAAPAGTPIRAPAAGLVVFADPAMHFEGGLTLIDHGQGLISAYLHQSAQSVRAGDRVVRGQEIGRVGMTGRATGPHLCWRLTWRGRHMDPSLMVGATAPA